MAADRSPAARRVAVAAGIVTVAALLVSWLGWYGSPPPMAADEEAYKVVDALFTAVNSRDSKQLERCDRQLRALKVAGRLPDKASDYLERVIIKAREGLWRPAAEQLYDFMRVQRR
jgi:hypothetical protein